MNFPYVVKQGDTICRIIRRFGINMTSFLNANNGLTEIDYLVPGQLLRIPMRLPGSYVIQPGDTLHQIALQWSVKQERITALNPGLVPGALQPGIQLMLPASENLELVQMGYPYGYMELMNDLEEMCSVYPMLKQESIGESVMGKPLQVLRLGEGPIRLHFNGAFHANEWITSLLLMKFAEDYAKALCTGARWKGCDIKRLHNRISLWIVPMVNPDGVELVLEGSNARHPYFEELLRMNRGNTRFDGWKANIRGVDLNDQFPAHWQEEVDRRAQEEPGPRDYPGEAPLTEPEAQAMAEFTERMAFDCVLAFHSQGKEIYWNYRDVEPSESEELARRLGAVSGYKPVKLTGSDAGYKDWFIQQYRKPGFTIEVGYGVNPLPLRDVRLIYEEASSIMLEAMKIMADT